VLCYVVVDAVAAASLAHALLRGAGTRWLAWPAVAWVGRVSYGAYLFHLLVLWLAAQALGANVREQPVVARLLLFAAVWLVTVALASASFRWFETPIARRGRAWLRPATAACSNPREYPMKTPSLNIVIAIATAGRREQMCLTMAELAKLGMLPARIVVCPASPDDYDADSFPLPACPVDVVHGPRGLTAQRNMILAHCQAADVVVFMDDDFYPAPDYIEQVAELFAREADVVIATNHPQLDGATGPGIAHDEAVHTIATLPPAAPAAPRTEGTYGGYGCNMAIRMAPVRQYTIRFDENLPLYGWLEDIDFSRRVAPHGRIVRCPQLRGVHLGTKRGRGSGLRLGYSQIANPVYMWRKGSMSPTYALRHMAKNFARNLSRSLAPEPWVDRRGRLRGNLLALRDLLRGRLDPRHILQMS
jgi:hypothetical protein